MRERPPGCVEFLPGILVELGPFKADEEGNPISPMWFQDKTGEWERTQAASEDFFEVNVPVSETKVP